MSGQIPEEFILDLRHRADIVEVIRDYVRLNKQGQNYKGLCPFHAEKTPSFVVSPHKQIFHCFGCGKGGNVFSFIMEKNALSFPDAVAYVAKKYGVEMPRKAVSPAQAKQNSLRKRYQHINELAANFYQNVLQGNLGRDALAYLRRRGLSAETVEKFLLGYAPDGWDHLVRYLNQEGVSPEEMITLGLASRSKTGNLIDRFRNRVMFPICDLRGKVIGFGGRVMDDNQPKYLNSPDTPLFNKGKNLYGLNLARGDIRNMDQAIIMEGYMDVISAYQHGITNAVGALGTALTPEQVRLLMRFTYNIATCFDSDTAGQEATLRGIDVLQKLGCRINIVQIPDGKDPDDFLKMVGAEEFKLLVKKAPTYLEYKLQSLMDKYETDTIQGKVQIVQMLVEDIRQVHSPVARQAFIQKVSEELSIPESTIHAELRKVQTLSDASRQTEPAGRRRVKHSASTKAERNVLRIIFENPQLIEKVEENGGKDLFIDPIYKEIYQSYYLLLQAGHNIKANDLISLIDNPEAQQVLPELLLEEEHQDTERVFQDCLTNLVLEGLNRTINEKSSLMSKLEEAGDISSSVEVMAQIQQLVREKQRLSATLRKGGDKI
ncbi:MAG: DNA primase [Peptococcia bacterium]